MSDSKDAKDHDHETQTSVPSSSHSPELGPNLGVSGSSSEADNKDNSTKGTRQESGYINHGEDGSVVGSLSDDGSMLESLDSEGSDDEGGNFRGAEGPTAINGDANGANDDRYQPQAIAMEDLADYNRSSNVRRRSSIFRSITPQSFDSNKLNRKTTSYSTKDIYGDLEDDRINLMRTQSQRTVLKTLSERLDKTDTYKDVPDISVPTKDFGKEFEEVDPELITWEGEDDPNYPRNWPVSTKVYQTAIVSLYTLITPMSSTICSPAMGAISKEFGITNVTIKALTVSIMVLAFALGPLIIAPLSESDKIGRKPVLNISIWIICVFNLASGFTHTTTQLCVIRFLGGLGGCASLNVGAGTIADLFGDDTRIYAMALYSICPTLGPVISPVISGFIVENLDWRWCFYIITIANAVVAVVGTFFFKETYSPKLLAQKAQFLREETGNNNLHTVFELTNNPNGEKQSWSLKAEIIKFTILRPIKLLCFHPMVLGLGSFMAFTYGFLYLMLVTFPAVFENSYGFSTGITGLMYIPMGIGYIIGTVVWTALIQLIYNRMVKKNFGIAKPEYRLPCLVFLGIGLPIGLIIYGWSVEYKLPWIVPGIGSAIFAFSFIAVFQTIQNYLIDMNPRFSASSVAAAAVFRSLLGFSFPLFATQMYDKLGYGWGNTLCALIGLFLGIPFPVFCLKYGESLRKWADKRIEEDQRKFDEKLLRKR